VSDRLELDGPGEITQSASTPDRELSRFKNLRKYSVFTEILLVAVLLILWFGSAGLRKSKSLWVLFFYNFPSMFLIPVVPHEPVFLYFSKFYKPLTVTSVALVGTLLTEFINYHVFSFFKVSRPLQNVQNTGFVKKLIALFNRAPFLALWVAGFTPIPFYPFRFLVVLAEYPLVKYLLSVALSRAPRYFLFALFGRAVPLPNYVLAVLFLVLILSAYFPVMLKKIRSH
jgi:membrane protein YqaA with SNARE-associated domain